MKKQNKIFTFFSVSSVCSVALISVFIRVNLWLIFLSALEPSWLKLNQSKIVNYAKQTQFAKYPNECNLTIDKELWKCTPPQPPPKQTQFKANQSQNKPNFQKAKMLVTLALTMTNNNEQRTMNWSKQTQSNPTCSELACPERNRRGRIYLVRLQRIQKAGRLADALQIGGFSE